MAYYKGQPPSFILDLTAQIVFKAEMINTWGRGLLLGREMALNVIFQVRNPD